jgi:hypothetical protein
VTFLDLWERFFELTVPEIYKNNRFAIRVLGCQVLNTAARVWIKKAKSLPGNMLIALLGAPRSGKSSIMGCMKAAVLGSHISILPRSTPEALVEAVHKDRVGILFWDEFEEVYKKSKDYMNTFSNLINQMYYLEDISFHRTTKPKISLPMRSYYFSATIACLPQQWKAIEASFMGGFERRWLTLSIRGRLPLFYMEEAKPEAAEILAKIALYLRGLQDKVIVVEDLYPRSYAQEVEREIEKSIRDPLKQGAAAEYFEKILAAEVVNLVLDDIIKGEVSVHVSNGVRRENSLSRSIIWTHMDYISDNMGQIWTLDRDKNPCDFFLVRPTDTLGQLGHRLVVEYDILKNLIWNITGVRPFEDAEMAKLVEKVEVARREKVAVTMRDFVRDVLGMRDAQWYRPRVEALAEAEVIRVVEHGRKKIVILDPDAKICGNCAKWTGLPCDASRVPLEMQAERELYSPLDECRYPERFERR